MPLTRERKENLVDEYAALLEESRAIIFTEYRGLTNQQLTDIRRKVREANGRLHVTKLTLLEIAMEKAGIPAPEDLSGAPIAVAFCLEEVPAVAKALTEFGEEVELLGIRGGYMNEIYLTEKQLKALADLPPLDDLRAMLAGLLDAPAANLVGVLQAGIAAPINVINAYVQQGEGGA